MSELREKFEKKITNYTMKEYSWADGDDLHYASYKGSMLIYPILEELVKRIETHLKMFKETIHTEDYGFCDIFDCDEHIRLKETLDKLNDWLEGR